MSLWRALQQLLPLPPVLHKHLHASTVRQCSHSLHAGRPQLPHVAPVLQLPPAAVVKDATTAAQAPKRKRPYIYVYDLPPAYNARMLQYRVEK